ncbi:MAG: sugar phosphate isomerase/epimerase [Planctomycetaceae bacterium]|nr:MAG: sugar phosphate isomerase/epimerase [Planctomycetaceae bacterium]
MSGTSSTKPAPQSRLAIHTITTKPWGLAEAVGHYAAQGIGGVSVWVEAIEGMSAGEAHRIIDDAGLRVPALVRGGFFCDAAASQRQARVDHNLGLIETAAELRAEMIVLVVGAVPGEPLDRQRGWVADAIDRLRGPAAAAGVRLAIEPLHPMYAAERSCINRIAEARRICERLDDPIVGVAVDVYHVWWDPDLSTEIERLGRDGSLFAFHLCDWRVPTRDLLNDRALMGDGCIDLVGLTRQVRAAGFTGWDEVEIFSDEHWQEDQAEFLERIVRRYAAIDQQAG